MTTVPAMPADDAPEQHSVPAGITLLLATACGLIVANIYYAQPLAGPIGAALGLHPGAAGLIVTLTQIGYGAGLLLIVPAGDLVENRKLVLCAVLVSALALIGAAVSIQPASFFAAALFIGLGSVAVQILVPYAAHLAPAPIRGQVVGNVMSGLMLGIMMARPVASFIAEVSSWRMVFFLSAGVMIALAAVMLRVLPKRVPKPGLGYGELIASMAHLLRETPVLQRRAIYHAFLFCAFSLFWTAAPLLLAGPDYRMSQAGIALFALAGVAGAVAAPIAGRLADRGWSKLGTGLAMACVAAAFVISRLGTLGSHFSLAMLVAAAIVLDFGVSANLVFGQRAIFTLQAEYRSRLNGVYMAIFFAGGAAGSALGGWCYAHGGWPLTSAAGVALPALALIYYATEYRTSPKARLRTFS